MTTNNAIATGVFDQFKVVADDLRRTLEGLEGDSLNWRPVGDESSSIYMLVTHMMGMANGMSTIAAGKTPNRDRAAEFAAAGTSVAPLLELIDDAAASGIAGIARWPSLPLYSVLTLLSSL